MAQLLTEPDWKPPTGNPLPVADTTVEFVVQPRGNPDGGVRVTYTMVDPHLQFVLPSPPPNGVQVVSHAQDRLVEDHPGIRTEAAPIARMLKVKGIGHPVLATLRVSVADLVGQIPVREHSSTDSITFSL
jgi:hypothetical protein